MPEAESVCHLYPIRVQGREEMREYLWERGIATCIHYPIPIHLQPAYQQLGYGRGDFPVSEAYAEQLLSLPMYPELEPEQIALVAQTVERFCRERGIDATPVAPAYAGPAWTGVEPG